MSATSERMAVCLANLFAEYQEATRPIDGKVARARFQGACDLAHAAGYGQTPTAVYSVVHKAWNTVGPRPGVSAENTERKAWIAQMTEKIVMHEWFA